MKAALEQDDVSIDDETDAQTGLYWLNGVRVFRRSPNGQGKGKYSSWDIQSWDRYTSQEDNWSRHTWETSRGEHDQDPESQANRRMMPPTRRWSKEAVTPAAENVVPTPPSPPPHSVPPTSPTYFSHQCQATHCEGVRATSSRWRAAPRESAGTTTSA